MTLLPKLQRKDFYINMHVSSHKLPHCNTHTKRTAEIVAQAYLKHLYATCGGSLTLITDNDKELKINSLKKLLFSLELKHPFLSPYHIQFTGILEKSHSFLKTCVHKHHCSKLSWKITNNFQSNFRMLLDIHSKERPLFLLFGRDP